MFLLIISFDYFIFLREPDSSTESEVKSPENLGLYNVHYVK